MTTTEPSSGISLDTVADLAAQLRVDSVRSSTSAGSGHPTSSMSAADLLAVLITRHLRYDWDEPRSPAGDHLIFSKGHASPLLYSVLKGRRRRVRRRADDRVPPVRAAAGGPPDPGAALGGRGHRVAGPGAAGEAFPIGGSKVLRSAGNDHVTLIGAGVTLHECLRAADALAGEGIAARVIDCYSVKPVDIATLTAAAEATAGRIVVAEDHRPEGGLGSAVADALLAAGQQNLHVVHLAVRGMPGSGSGTELLAWAGIDAGHIAGAARRLIDGR